MGVMGLALAGSLGGWVLFVLTLRELGWERMRPIVLNVRLLYWGAGLGAFAALLWLFNGWLIGLIRGA